MRVIKRADKLRGKYVIEITSNFKKWHYYSENYDEKTALFIADYLVKRVKEYNESLKDVGKVITTINIQ